MTTQDFRGNEIFKPNTNIATILTFGLKNGVEKLETIIKNTYTKKDAETILNIINELN